MPVYRDAHGKIVEEKTDMPAEQTRPTNQEGSLPLTSPTGDETGKGRLDAPTRKMEKSRRVSPGDDKTRLVGSRRRRADQERMREQADKTDAMDDPVVGWLVIIQGPGKGRSLRVGYGANSVGRGEDNRVSLDFGDAQISREQHAKVTYDPRGRKFYMQPGSGANLAYLDEQPVLAPMELAAQSDITLGNTTLRFVPFCGEDFDWQGNGDDIT